MMGGMQVWAVECCPNCKDHRLKVFDNQEKAREYTRTLESEGRKVQMWEM